MTKHDINLDTGLGLELDNINKREDFKNKTDEAYGIFLVLVDPTS